MPAASTTVSPRLQSFLSEIPGVSANDSPAASPAMVLAQAQPPPSSTPAVPAKQHLKMNVPNPRTYLRLGASNNKDYGLDGFLTSTAAHAGIIADCNVISVAGYGNQKEAYKFAKAESTGQGMAQTVIAGTLDLMKMMLAPGHTGLGLAGGLASIGFGVSKVAIEKKKSGTLSLTAKESFSAVSAGSAQVAAAISTTVWAGVATKCGAGVSVSIQGGAVASMAALKTAAVVSAHEAELVSGWETEVASRFGETSIRGKEIQIGVSDHGLAQNLLIPALRQRSTEEVHVHADEAIRLATGGGHGVHTKHRTLVKLKDGKVEISAEEAAIKPKKEAVVQVGSTALKLEPDKAQLSIAPSLQPSLEAEKAAVDGWLAAVTTAAAARKAALGAGTTPMAAHAAAAAARAAADAAYTASKAAALAARDAAMEAAKLSAPTLEMSQEEITVSTSKTNGVEISRVKGIKLTSGAGEITMSPAGIVLKFGASKIILGPAGVVIDAGPGLITQKATLVNSP